MSAHVEITFESERFNITQVKDYFINECCFGDDVAAFLHEKLSELGIDVNEPGQEDWGWYLEVEHEGQWYFLGISGNLQEVPNSKVGEWQIIIEKVRTLKDKLLKKNRLSEDEELIHLLRRVLGSDPAIAKLSVEEYSS